MPPMTKPNSPETVAELPIVDGRDPRPNPLQPIFRDHNCWKCRDGELTCTGRSDGDYGRCEYPHARND
jgi:hypothetical protein